MGIGIDGQQSVTAHHYHTFLFYLFDEILLAFGELLIVAFFHPF